jgi:hypothetical protein
MNKIQLSKMKKVLFFLLILFGKTVFAQSFLTVRESRNVINTFFELHLISSDTQKMFLRKLANKSENDTTSAKSQLFESASIWENHLAEKKERYKERKTRREEAYSLPDSSAYESIGSFWIDFRDVQQEKGLWGSGFTRYDYNKVESKKFSKNELETLQLLLNKRIINEREYQHAIDNFQKNYDGGLPGEFLGRLYETIYFYENYNKLKQDQIRQLDNLRLKKGWLSERNYQKLIESYNPYQLHSYHTIVDNLDNAFAINLLDSLENKVIYYEKLLEKIKKKHLILSIKNWKLNK